MTFDISGSQCRRRAAFGWEDCSLGSVSGCLHQKGKMVSCRRELFRRGACDETFGGKMRVISICGKLEGRRCGLWERFPSECVVMPGLVPGIHVLNAGAVQERGWPGQARP